MLLNILISSLMMTTCYPAAGTDLTAAQADHHSEFNPAGKKGNIPFTGFRMFNIYHAFSGSGTPATFVQILDDGEVIFYMMQENQASGEAYQEEYNAGQYSKVMKCHFKYDNITRYYEITPDKIYEVDKNGKRLSYNECCDADMLGNGTECPCESDMYEAG